MNEEKQPEDKINASEESNINTPPESVPDKKSTDIEINDDKERERLELEIKLRRIKRRQKYEKKKENKKKLKIILALFFVIVIISGDLSVYFIFKAAPLKSSEHILKYMESEFFDTAIYIDGEKIPASIPPAYDNESVYIPVSFVFSNLSHNILYDESDEIVSIATDTEVVKLSKAQNMYYVNGVKAQPVVPPLILKNSEAYISKEIIEKFYPVNINFSKENRTLVFDSTQIPRTTAIVKEDEKLYNEKGDFLGITIIKGEYITLYEENNKTAKIITSDGLCGYIDIDSMENKIKQEPIEKTPVKNQTLTVKGKPVILFDQVLNATANYNSSKKDIPSAVDVLVPTWFSFSVDSAGNTDGKINSIADETYVNAAHTKGRKVWGLITDNFSSQVSRTVVNSVKTREYVINQLINYTSQYNLDGINIDFENIPADSMREFTQFLRELSVELNNMDVCLSIDVYTPETWSSYYNRDEFGEIVDYFIVMGYDEHAGNSETSGSVATKKWSEDSITLTCDAGVPAEKLLLAIPFYTRIWKENPDGTLETRAYGMEEGYNIMTSRGGTFKWLEEAGQNYAQTNYNNSVYKMWLEDEKSVEERLKLVKKYNIAGLAAWKRNLEKPAVWPVIQKYMKGQ